MWKLLFQNVRGTSHVRSQQPCQDHCRARLRQTAQGPVLVLVAADGAGSARHADLGARQACRLVTRLVFADLVEGLTLPRIDRDTVLSWHVRLRQNLEADAARLQTEPHDLACTLLLAVVGTETAVFSQIGDGAIVVRDGDSYQPVFWPQSGEYANTTNFVTDLAFADNLAFERRDGPVDELALFTDGLQMLALNFATHAVHVPFFLPMFRQLRGTRAGAGLPRALRNFLSSHAVNQRSDDDKTLILATRVPAGAPAT
jgi:hypothetical protein